MQLNNELTVEKIEYINSTNYAEIKTYITRKNLEITKKPEGKKLMGVCYG